MAYVPTENEKRAANLEEKAVQHLIDAMKLLGEAEATLFAEERLHSAPSPSNNYAMERYTDVGNEIEHLYEKLTGKPYIQIISSKITGGEVMNVEPIVG